MHRPLFYASFGLSVYILLFALLDAAIAVATEARLPVQANIVRAVTLEELGEACADGYTTVCEKYAERMAIELNEIEPAVGSTVWVADPKDCPVGVVCRIAEFEYQRRTRKGFYHDPDPRNKSRD